VIGPQASIISASAAWAEWNPYARRVMSRTLVVERLNPGVVAPKPDGGEDAIAVLADRGGELDERFQAAAAGLDAPAVQQLGRLAGGEVTGEDLAQALLELVGAPCRAAVAAQLAQRGGLLGRQSLGSLGAAPSVPP
jgi:hypothetical protein